MAKLSAINKNNRRRKPTKKCINCWELFDGETNYLKK